MITKSTRLLNGSRDPQGDPTRMLRFSHPVVGVGPGSNLRALRIHLFAALLLGLCGSGSAQTTPRPALNADRVMVLKKDRVLELLSAGKVIRTYKVALGGDPVGPKTRQGDHKTPEGVYVLDSRNAHDKPVYQDLRSFLDRCRCHRALFNGTPDCHRTNTALRLGRSAAAAALCSEDYPVCQGPETT